MKHRLIILPLILAIMIPATALTLTVEYVEGRVESRSTSGWKPLKEGDMVEESASLRLAQGGLVELDNNGETISIIEAGTYVIADIISARMEVSSWDLVDIVGRKIALTFDRKKTGSVTSSLGVRGDEIDEDDVEWMYSDNAADTLETAKVFIDVGEYDKAVALLIDYSNTAPETEMTIVNYYIAYAYSLLDKKSLALNFINRASPNSEDTIYPEFVLLKGKLLLECLSYERALALFEDYLDKVPKGKVAQTVLILEAFCYKGIGKSDEQRECLVRARDLGPDSEEGERAKKLLLKTQK